MCTPKQQNRSSLSFLNSFIFLIGRKLLYNVVNVVLVSGSPPLPFFFFFWTFGEHPVYSSDSCITLQFSDVPMLARDARFHAFFTGVNCFVVWPYFIVFIQLANNRHQRHFRVLAVRKNNECHILIHSSWCAFIWDFLGDIYSSATTESIRLGTAKPFPGDLRISGIHILANTWYGQDF